MKKLLFMIGLGIVSSMYVNSVTASILGIGIKVSYEKGTMEWNADKTKTYCVGKGVCRLEVSADVPLGIYDGGIAVGIIGYSENGQFCMVFPKSILSNSEWAETFQNGRLYVGKDIILNSTVRSKLKNCPMLIKAGNYNYSVIDNEVLIALAN
ncbi:MAG: hypothetical protein IPI46_12230 [Bacteroidetes bacterium]|nr:hypothetical protein [Bacteroidota bacterium]